MIATRAWAEKPMVLPEITVEASPLDVYLPASTEIPREELIDSQKSELPDVLKLAPGVNVREGGRAEPRLDLRGFDQRATLFTLNGVPVYEPYNGVVNLNLFPLDMLGGVQIDRGPSSSLFGPNGMAGTVKMTTFRSPVPLSAAASTIWRDPNFWDVRASAGVARDAFSGMIGGRFLTSSGLPLSGEFDDRPASRRRFDNGGLRRDSDREEKSGFADFEYQLPSDGRIHLAMLGSEAGFGIPPSTTQFGVPTSTGQFVPFIRRNDHQEFDHLQAGLDQQLTPNVALGVAVFYSDYSTHETQITGSDLSTKVVTSAKSDELGGIGRLTFYLGDTDSLAVSGQVRHAGADVSDPTSGQIEPDFATTSAGVENVYFITDRIRFLMGLSYDLQTGGGRGTAWELDPEGGLSVDLGRFGTARTGVSRKIRFPTLRELFDPLQGNPSLSPEKALTYEVGHRVTVEHFYVDASLLRSEVSDLIEVDDTGDVGKAMNFEQATLEGFEIAGGATPWPFARLDVNYTFLDTQVRQHLPTGVTASSEIQHKPPHRFNGILRLLLPRRFQLRFEGLYTSEQLDQFGTVNRVDGFALFNVQLVKALGDHFDVFVGADNVLDADYEEKLGSPEAGRRAYAGLRARY